MVLFINNSDVIGSITIGMTNNITGQLGLTLLLVFIIFLALFIAFRVPIEWVMALLLPLMMVMMAFDSFFLLFGGIMLILLAILFAKSFFLN